jgi:hypothetical protein
MTVAADKDFVSIGQFAAHVQRPVRKIEQAAISLKIQPALRINGVPYFNGRQVEELTETLRNTERQR